MKQQNLMSSDAATGRLIWLESERLWLTLLFITIIELIGDIGSKFTSFIINHCKYEVF